MMPAVVPLNNKAFVDCCRSSQRVSVGYLKNDEQAWVKPLNVVYMMFKLYLSSIWKVVVGEQSECVREREREGGRGKGREREEIIVCVRAYCSSNKKQLTHQ